MGGGHGPAGTSRVDDAHWFDENGVDFAIGDGAMLDATWHDEQLAGSTVTIAGAQLDGECPGQDQEQLIGLLVRGARQTLR